MPHPKAYSPEPGQMYQLFCRKDSREWEHCDYAKDRAEKKQMQAGYLMAYRGFELKTIMLPAKYWPKKTRTASIRNTQGKVVQ